MDRIVVLGSGTMAVGIAAGFIEAGVPVVVLGRSLEKARTALAASVETARGLAGAALAPAAHVAGEMLALADVPIAGVVAH